MMRWLRRLRGAVGIGAIWGVAGTAVGAAASVVASVMGGIPLLGSLVIFGLGTGAVCFVLGTGFSGLLMMAEGRRTLDELSPWRAALWGALAGVALPVGWLFISAGAPWTVLPVGRALVLLIAASGSYGALGAAMAAGTVWAARKAPSELPPGRPPDDDKLVGPRPP